MYKHLLDLTSGGGVSLRGPYCQVPVTSMCIIIISIMRSEIVCIIIIISIIRIISISIISMFSIIIIISSSSNSSNSSTSLPFSFVLLGAPLFVLQGAPLAGVPPPAPAAGLCVDIHAHTYMHTYMHACIHTYVHTYICIIQ